MDSQLHEIGYTQHCDVPLRRVQILDLDFEASRQRSRLFFHSFLSVMASDELLWSLFQESLCSQLASFVIERSNVLAVGGAKTTLLSAHRLISA